jgi:tetratricopeptide (TPR) repeat protein
LLSTATILDPKNIIGHVCMGNALSSLGNEEEAIECYSKVIALDPNHVEAHISMGLAFENLERKDEAI